MAPASSGLKRIGQLAELADSIAGQHERCAIISFHIKERRSSGWEIPPASIGQREQYMDLAMDVVPAMDR